MRIILILVVLMASLPVSAYAQTTTQHFTIRNGKLVGGDTAAPQASGAASSGNSGGGITLNSEQQYMIAALSALVQKDLPRAESLYSQVISMNGSNSEAYLQRGIARRESGDTHGMTSDAKMALTLLNNEIRQHPREVNLYRKRSMALRLLQSFDLAKKDLLTAMQLTGKSSVTLQNDMQAIELERRMASAAR